MTDAERNLGGRWFAEVWNQQRRESIAELLAPDAVLHEGDSDSRGPEGFYPFFDRMNAAFTDLRVHIEDTFAEGDKICVRWLCTARHTGEGLGLTPSHAPVRVTGMSILRVAGGKVVEGWQNWDMLGMIEQTRGSRSKPALYVAAT